MAEYTKEWKVLFTQTTQFALEANGLGMRVQLRKPIPREEVQAIANLMAAAPELYEACKDALEALRWLPDLLSGTIHKDTKIKLRQVIAKAEGK